MSAYCHKSDQSIKIVFKGDLQTPADTRKIMDVYFGLISVVVAHVYNRAGVELGDHTITLRIPETNADNYKRPEDRVDLSALAAKTRFRDGKTTFADIIGHNEAKQYLKSLADALKRNDYTKWCISPPSGILMYGPPGNGKTSLARALSNEAGFTFRHVDVPTLLSSYHGRTSQNIEALFEITDDGATIIFIDEIDSLTRSRAESQSHGSVEVLGTLLEKMDGIRRRRTPVILLGSTNEIGLVDSAFFRPGRFTYHLNIPNPTPDLRREVLLNYALKHRLKKAPATFEDILRVDRIIELSEGESCSFMEEVVRTAVETKMFELGGKTEDNTPPITELDLINATEKVNHMRYEKASRGSMLLRPS